MGWEIGLQPYTGIVAGVYTQVHEDGWTFFIYLPLIAIYFDYYRTK